MPELLGRLAKLSVALENNDINAMRQLLKSVVAGYAPKNGAMVEQNHPIQNGREEGND